MFAVFFAIAMQSVNKGMFDHMEHGMIKSFMGFAQIHSNGFWEDQTLDNAFVLDESIEQSASNYNDIENLVPRLESFALCSGNKTTKGAMVIGMDATKEDELTGLKAKISEGEYFAENDSTVLVAEGLAEYLGLGVNDTLVLLSSGYQGASAAALYIIKGIVKFPSPELNNQMVYLPLETAQEFYNAYDMVTTAVVNSTQPEKIKSTVSQLSADLGEEYEVMHYEELMPDMIQARQIKESGQFFMLIILYAIIASGIFGTILMMIKERQYEFGVLTAIGLKRRELSFVVWLETVFIGFIGVLAGCLISLPLVVGLKLNPVAVQGEMAAAYEEFGIEPLIMSSTAPEIFINQAITVFIMVTLMAIYPTFKILNLKPVEAMRS
jgi:ABC-type lipoprotein release transport system permease subunit